MWAICPRVASHWNCPGSKIKIRPLCRKRSRRRDGRVKNEVLRRRAQRHFSNLQEWHPAVISECWKQSVRDVTGSGVNYCAVWPGNLSPQRILLSCKNQYWCSSDTIPLSRHDHSCRDQSGRFLTSRNYHQLPGDAETSFKSGQTEWDAVVFGCSRYL